MEESTLQAQASARKRGGNRPKGKGGLGRALRYLPKQGATIWAAYGALIIASLAQLAVPKLIENMINNVTYGTVATQAQGIFFNLAAARLNMTPDQLVAYKDNGETWLIYGALAIVAFAIMRGLFSFIQTYMAERASQGLAFDFRNEIFSKIQRLSFSYYDRNQTGQLMIRATDDVEKVRLFIAQGLVMAAQAFLLLIATLIILFLTNWRLTLAVLPILPVALILFVIFGALTQPLF